MKVILTQSVPGLGDAGAIKEVADGYARNFLIPRRLAVAATQGSLKQAEAQAEVFARRAQKAMGELQKTAGGIQDKTVTIRARVGSENRLYGSVTSADVAEALEQQTGVTVDRRKIHLDEAIHRTGVYGATVDLGNGVTAKFNVEVAPQVAGATGRAARASAESPVEATSQEAATTTEEEEMETAEGEDLAGEDVTPTEPEAEEQVESNPS